jgi:hypothetical protein
MKTVVGVLALVGSLLLGGCASRASRVEAALAQAGVSARMAACLAPRLADRLRDDQLRALARAAKRASGDSGKAGASEIVARVAGTGDPEIIGVVSAAALHCALKG